MTEKTVNERAQEICDTLVQQCDELAAKCREARDDWEKRAAAASPTPLCKALAVLALTRTTRLFLMKYDPKALAQADRALEGAGFGVMVEAARAVMKETLTDVRGGRACSTCGEPWTFKAIGHAVCTRCEAADDLLKEAAKES